MAIQLEHHKKILTILNSLNSEVLKKGSAYFGGGTLLTFDFEEYRWSKDIDFLSPVSTSGYKYLRTLIFDFGYEALFNNLNSIQIGRGTTDQYGIRMIVIVDGEPIKTEVIAESRFELDPPRYPSWSPVPCLTINDCFTSKLLSNSDRYMDDSVEARDLIDLAILRSHFAIPQIALDKAEKAYEVKRPLKAAIKRFQENSNFRQKCFLGLQIDKVFYPKIIDGIDFLANDLNLTATERLFNEQHDLFI